MYIGYSWDGDVIEIYLAFHIKEFVIKILLLVSFFIYFIFNVFNIQYLPTIALKKGKQYELII